MTDRSRIDHEQLSKALGATVRGEVRAHAGPFGAVQTALDVGSQRLASALSNEILARLERELAILGRAGTTLTRDELVRRLVLRGLARLESDETEREALRRSA